MLGFTLITVVSFLIFGNSDAIGQSCGSNAVGVFLVILGYLAPLPLLRMHPRLLLRVPCY